MLTVRDAAKRAGRNAETVRRWIRTGHLKANKIGPRYLIDEDDLDELVGDEELPVPPEWRTMPDGRPMPNVVRAIRLSRQDRDARLLRSLAHVVKVTGPTEN